MEPLINQELDIESKVAILITARKAYDAGHPIMTDPEYDALEKMVRGVDPDHPFFETVGHILSSGWDKAKHSIFMGSLEKIHSEKDFMKFAQKFDEGTLFSMQYKLDGLSLSLDYDDSDFVRAITRGDGEIGEDISDNVVLMDGFKESVPGYTGSIRAEIVLGKGIFNQINSTLSDDDKYANPRNGAAGISRRLDGRFSKFLHIIAYDMTDPLDEPDKIKKLRDMGFHVPVEVVGDYKKVIETFNNVVKGRKALPYDIDGMVVKVCSHETKERMGVVNKKPKAHKGWKFEAPGAGTVFLEEEWDVGRTGVVTPLANLVPVVIEGSEIKKATLHNVAEIKRLGIGRGDTVMLEKRGDIIPKITAILIHEGNPIEIPTNCPSCDSILSNDGTTLRCLNDYCPRKNFNRILNWIKVVGIDSFGESLAEFLFDSGKVCSIADIYTLTKNDISGIERWGDKSAEKIIENIKKVKKLTPEKFLCALGIPSISESTSTELLQIFETLENLMERTEDDIKKLKGYSDVSAKKIVEGLSKAKTEIDFLLTLITLGSEEENQGILSGLSFCFTGKPPEHPKSYYQKIVTQLGGENRKSVVKDLSYLVCAEDVGSGKSVKAAKYGVKVLNIQEFMALVGDVEPEEEKPEVSVSLVEDCCSLFDED